MLLVLKSCFVTEASRSLPNPRLSLARHGSHLEGRQKELETSLNEVGAVACFQVDGRYVFGHLLRQLGVRSFGRLHIEMEMLNFALDVMLELEYFIPTP